MTTHLFFAQWLHRSLTSVSPIALIFVVVGCAAAAAQAAGCTLTPIRFAPQPPPGLVAGTFSESFGSMYLFNASVISYGSVQQLTWTTLLGVGGDSRIVDGMDARFKAVSALVMVEGWVPTLILFDDTTLRTIDLFLQNTSTWYGEPGESAVVDDYAPKARILSGGFGAASPRQGRLFFSATDSHCVRLWKYGIEVFPAQLTYDPRPEYFLSTVAGNCSQRGRLSLGTSSTTAAARFDSIHSLAVSDGDKTATVYVADAVGLHRFTVGGTVATLFVPGSPSFPIGSLVFSLAAIQTVFDGDVLFTVGLPTAAPNQSCTIYRYSATANSFLQDSIALNLSSMPMPNATCGDLRIMPRPARNFTYFAVGTSIFRAAKCDSIVFEISTSVPIPEATDSPPEPTYNTTTTGKRSIVAVAVGVSLGGFAVVLLGVAFRFHTSDRFDFRRQRSMRLRQVSDPNHNPSGDSAPPVVAAERETTRLVTVPALPTISDGSDSDARVRRLSPSPNEPAHLVYHYDPVRSPQPQAFRITASDGSNDSAHVPTSPRAAWDQSAEHETRPFPPPPFCGYSDHSFELREPEGDNGGTAARRGKEPKRDPTPPHEFPLEQSTDSIDSRGRIGSGRLRNISALAAVELKEVNSSGECPEIGNDGPPPVTPVAKDELCHSGHLHRLKLVGRGTSGSVYAVLLADGSTVAMKEMLLTLPGEDFSRQLAEVQREISVMSQLEHPRIVKYYYSKADLGEMKVNIFMELVTGGSLTKMARDVDGPIAESLLRRYIRQTVEGLAFIHSKGIVHRDLKGENLLLTGEGSVKIADFGTARVLCPLGNLAQTMIGTPLFMAPEILSDLTEDSDTAGYGAKADIWSLGITVCELANRGQPPWPTFSSPGQAFAHIANPAHSPIVPSYLSDTAKDFVRRCCTRDPARRPSAAELKAHPWISAKRQSSSEGSLESSLGSG